MRPRGGGGTVVSVEERTPTGLTRVAVPFAHSDPNARIEERIRLLRWYVARRLVVEGGFRPDRIRPRPPISVEWNRRGAFLHRNSDAAKPGRRTLLGGLGTRRVDVTVTVPGVGPVLAVSVKWTHCGSEGLTQGLEQVAGGCVNIHMGYPALVYGFWHVLGVTVGGDVARPARGRPADGGRVSDAFDYRQGGELDRYGRALRRLSERGDLRDDPSRYEACGLTLTRYVGELELSVLDSGHPDSGSVLDFNRMFRRLYAIYDRRFVFSAPKLARRTAREYWHPESPLLTETGLEDEGLGDMTARVGSDPTAGESAGGRRTPDCIGTAH